MTAMLVKLSSREKYKEIFSIDEELPPVDVRVATFHRFVCMPPFGSECIELEGTGCMNDDDEWYDTTLYAEAITDWAYINELDVTEDLSLVEEMVDDLIEEVHATSIGHRGDVSGSKARLMSIIDSVMARKFDFDVVKPPPDVVVVAFHKDYDMDDDGPEYYEYASMIYIDEDGDVIACDGSLFSGASITHWMYIPE